jgi:hypothetical protein
MLRDFFYFRGQLNHYKLKNLYTAIIALLCLHTAVAQETQNTASVEKSLFNIQTGAVGAWVSYEGRLSNRWALRAEVGLDLWMYEAYDNMGQTDKGVTLVPSIAIEPRWYYNIGKRAEKGRNTANNSANFVTLAVEYYPNLFVIGGPDYLEMREQISFIPKWGIRRAIAQSNFNYELGIGVGPVWYLSDDYHYESESDVAIDAHIRIGYTF